MSRTFPQRLPELMDGPPSRTRSIYAVFLQVQANHQRSSIRCRLRPSGHDWKDITLNVRETHRNDDGTVGGKAGEIPNTFSVSVRRCSDCECLSTASVVLAMDEEAVGEEDRKLVEELRAMGGG